MVLFVVTGLVILIPIIILHYKQHFELELLCKKSNAPVFLSQISDTTSKTVSATIKRHPTQLKHCCCSLTSIDDEELNFFPISFLCYMLCLLCLYLIMITIGMINYCNHFFGNDSNNITRLHRTAASDPSNIYVYIYNYILIYGVLILSIWESLFSFYRYYTTFVINNELHLISSLPVVLKFSIFGVIFSIIYIIEMHFCYWLFPVVIIIYYAFNWYCNWKFASILIKRFAELKSIESTSAQNSLSSNDEVLDSVYYMRRVSLICCILQSISITTVVIIDDVHIIDYLPILWSISCMIFALNFIRNRWKLKQITYKLCCRSKHSDSEITDTGVDALSPPIIPLTPITLNTQNAVNTPMIPLTPYSSKNSMHMVPKLQFRHSSPIKVNKSIQRHVIHDESRDDLDVVYTKNEPVSNGTKQLQIKIEIVRQKPQKMNELTYPKSSPDLLFAPSCSLTPASPTTKLQDLDTPDKTNKDGGYSRTSRRSMSVTAFSNSFPTSTVNMDDPEIQSIEEKKPNSIPPSSRISNANLTHLSLHRKSTSLPIDIDGYLVDNTEIDIDKVLRSFNILAKYGFCVLVRHPTRNNQ